MKNKLLFFLLLLAVFVVVYHQWLFSFSILTHGDWPYSFRESTLSQRLNFFHLWQSDFSFGNFSFGRVLYDVGQTPTYFLYGLLAILFNLDYSLLERIIHLWPIIIFTPLSSYILLKGIFSNKIAIFIGIIVYTFNTYFLYSQTGHITLMTAFSLLPFVLYSFQVTLENLSYPRAVFTGLLFFIVSAYEPRIAYILFGLLFLYLIYYLFLHKSPYIKSNYLRIVAISLIPFIILAFTNVYWVLGIANMGALTSNPLFERGIYGGELYNILYAITLFHPFWTGTTLQVFTTQSILIYAWIIPILSILGLLINKNNSKILFYGIITVLGIFLSKQNGEPFPSLYTYLYNYLPGFNAFREASKFYSLVALGYSVLIAAFFQWLWDKWNKGKLQIYGKYLLTGIVILTLLWNTKPLITGEIGTLFQSRKVPNDFLTVKDFILKQDDYFRTLWVPIYSRWSIYTNQNPEFSMIHVVNSEWKNYSNNTSGRNTETDNIIKLAKQKEFEYLLDITSTKYVIVSSRTKYNEEDWVGPTDNRIKYIDVLDKIDHLKKVNIGTKEIAIYENSNFKPHIYLTQKKESIDDYVPFKEVRHTFVNSTRYSISFNNIKELMYLNFSESYHPDWRIRVGGFNWSDVVRNQEYFLPEDIHFQNTSGLNGYIIDPEKICKEYDCSRNEDGSYDIEMTLYFKPQSYLYLGMIISGTTLFLCLGYLAYYGIKKAKTKN